jgi:hypothetical protein
MASSYLDLYQGAGGLRQRNILGMSSPYQRPQFSFGTPQNVFYQAGETQRVVHDKYNNIYYGQQKQSDLIKGLQDSIKRTQDQLKAKSETRYSTGWMGALNTSNYFYTAADRKAQNDRITQQQAYLKHVQNGGYKQEGNQFYKSYDAYTGDWNNVFKRRKSNADQKEANRLQAIENEKTRVRNKKIEGQNQTLAQKEREAKESQISTGSKARAKKLTPNLEINTGISAAADKLVQSLNKTGLSI